MRLVHLELTHRILACAYEVHAQLGAGLLESVYRMCLAHELRMNGLATECEVSIALDYKGARLDTGFRADIIAAGSVLLELKACERILPIHEAQCLTYLRLCDLEVGLLLNFNVVSLKNGVRRFVNHRAARREKTPSTP